MSDNLTLICFLAFFVLMLLIVAIADSNSKTELDKLRTACAVYEAEIKLLKEVGK